MIAAAVVVDSSQWHVPDPCFLWGSDVLLDRTLTLVSLLILPYSVRYLHPYSPLVTKFYIPRSVLL